MAPILPVLVLVLTFFRVVYTSPVAPRALSDTDLAIITAGEDHSADGLYAIHEHPETRERKHFKIRSHNETEASTGAAILKRPGRLVSRYNGFPDNTYITCSDSYAWGEDLYQHAYDGLWGHCWGEGAGSMPILAGRYSYVYYRYGQAVVYFCNFGVGEHANGNKCTNSEWGTSVDYMQKTCTGGNNGWDQAAIFHVPKWNKVNTQKRVALVLR
jgi:hypothetical protein